MSSPLAIQLSEQAFASLTAAAIAAGKTPAEQAAAAVESMYAAAGIPSAGPAPSSNSFERHFGSVDLDAPIGIVNAAIDADLGREYGAASAPQP